MDFIAVDVYSVAAPLAIGGTVYGVAPGCVGARNDAPQGWLPRRCALPTRKHGRGRQDCRGGRLAP